MAIRTHHLAWVAWAIGTKLLAEHWHTTVDNNKQSADGMMDTATIMCDLMLPKFVLGHNWFEKRLWPNHKLYVP